MKYDYSVKVNGKWYKSGEEVPDFAETETTDYTNVDVLTTTETNDSDKKPTKKKN